MENLISGNGSLVQSAQSNHLNSLKSLCELVIREVNVLSTVSTKNEGLPENKKIISLSEEVERFEINLIKSALLQAGGRQKKAAEILGIKITTLNTKIKRYGIDFK